MQRQKYPWNQPKFVVVNHRPCGEFDMLSNRHCNRKVNHAVFQLDFVFEPQVDHDFLKLSDHVLDILKFKFMKLNLSQDLHIIHEFKIYMLVTNMILYHCFLMCEPHRIVFDFTTALLSLSGRGLTGAFTIACGTQYWSFIAL